MENDGKWRSKSRNVLFLQLLGDLFRRKDDHMGFKIKKLVDLTRANQPRSRFELSKLLNKQNINLVGGFKHLETY